MYSQAEVRLAEVFDQHQNPAKFVPLWVKNRSAVGRSRDIQAPGNSPIGADNIYVFFHSFLGHRKSDVLAVRRPTRAVAALVLIGRNGVW